MCARIYLGIAIAAALSLGGTASAGAADYYVDLEATDPDDVCVLADPCNGIEEAIDIADADTVPDTIHVGPGLSPYPSVIVTNSPMTLVGDDYAGVGGGTTTVIDGGPDTGVILNAGAGTRTIRGFTIRGGDIAATSQSLQALISNTITVGPDNVFDDADVDVDRLIDLEGGSSRVTGNTFSGADLGETQVGISYTGAGPSPEIDHNAMTAFFNGIVVNGPANANIHDNTIAGIYDSGIFIPAGIMFANASGTVARNQILGDPGNTSGNGIRTSVSAATGTPLTISRTLVSGFADNGVNLAGKDNAIVNDSVLVKNGTGLASFLDPADPSNLTVVGSTIADNTFVRQMYMDDTSLILDSSIVGSGVSANDDIERVGTSICSIAFSRGPTLAAGSPTDCNDFQTTALPAFGNTVDYPLTLANPALIDAGNPAAPASPVDFGGDPRALDGIANGSCLPRRDIGADEVVTANADCSPPSPPPATTPVTNPVTNPPTTTTTRRCPKGKKLVTVKNKHGKKKKKCKRKRKKRKK
jgi:hypothetical protein